MSLARRLAAVLLPAALLATGGCLATQGDIEKLQLTLKAMQDSMRVREARSDSAQAQLIRLTAQQQSQQLSQQFSREFNLLSDSVRQVSSSLQRLQGDVTLAMHDLRSQLTIVQEGIGQSQKRIQDLKSSVESAAPTMPAPAPAAAQGKGTAIAAPAAPPAAQLFTSGRTSLISNATGAARDAFQTLLDNYPNYDRAGEAQMFIADAYAQEGNRAAADSVYALVVTKYPGTSEASRSLYKRAMALKEAGQTAAALKLFEEIVAKYPRSDMRELADIELAALRKKP